MPIFDVWHLNVPLRRWPQRDPSSAARCPPLRSHMKMNNQNAAFVVVFSVIFMRRTQAHCLTPPQICRSFALLAMALALARLRWSNHRRSAARRLRFASSVITNRAHCRHFSHWNMEHVWIMWRPIHFTVSDVSEAKKLSACLWFWAWNTFVLHTTEETRGLSIIMPRTQR